MKRILSVILAMAIVICSSNLTLASALGNNLDTDFKLIHSSELNSSMTELTEKNGILTFFYKDSINGKVLVITQSEEAGVNAYYNDGKSVYEISGITNINLNSISLGEDLNILAKNFINDYSNFINNDSIKQIYHNENKEDLNKYLIEPKGLPNVTQQFYNRVGNPFSNRFIASSTINGKVAVVLETKDVTVKQVSKIMAFKGDVLAAFLAIWAIAPGIANLLAIVTIIRDGIEYIKDDNVILEYRGSLSGYKEVFVQNLSSHKVSRESIYRILENTGNDAVTFEIQWQWAEPDYNNNTRLMEIAVSNYN